MDEGFLLETAHLCLRGYRPKDVDLLAPMFADPDHMRFYPSPFTREQTEAWVERQLQRYRDDGFGLWIVEGNATDEFLGTAGPTVQMVEGVREVEIGWHVRPGRKGRGIAPEAGAVARDWAFVTLEVDHVISLVRPGERCLGPGRREARDAGGPRGGARGVPAPRLPR